MTRVLRVHLPDGAARRLEVEAARCGMSLPLYAGRHLTAEAKALPEARKPSPPKTTREAYAVRRWSVNAIAVDRASMPRRSVTAVLMGDPER